MVTTFNSTYIKILTELQEVETSMSVMLFEEKYIKLPEPQGNEGS